MFIVAMILVLLAFFILVLSFYNQCYECNTPVLPQYYDEMQMTVRAWEGREGEFDDNDVVFNDFYDVKRSLSNTSKHIIK